MDPVRPFLRRKFQWDNFCSCFLKNTAHLAHNPLLPELCACEKRERNDFCGVFVTVGGVYQTRGAAPAGWGAKSTTLNTARSFDLTKILTVFSDEFWPFSSSKMMVTFPCVIQFPQQFSGQVKVPRSQRFFHAGGDSRERGATRLVSDIADDSIKYKGNYPEFVHRFWKFLTKKIIQVDVSQNTLLGILTSQIFRRQQTCVCVSHAAPQGPTPCIAARFTFPAVCAVCVLRTNRRLSLQLHP